MKDGEIVRQLNSHNPMREHTSSCLRYEINQMTLRSAVPGVSDNITPGVSVEVSKIETLKRSVCKQRNNVKPPPPPPPSYFSKIFGNHRRINNEKNAGRSTFFTL